ncbi:hypothetical protein EVAR_79518_1 [Eumeta japonica]|uniref:Uncharacterized protein n=1 Tax=Eumeta variegata TaxID=151549 RepID=A0A4C1UER9_EUMVA|nr:hypothetical protein EVAR_79518_1 [Eumeta japonica]
MDYLRQEPETPGESFSESRPVTYHIFWRGHELTDTAKRKQIKWFSSFCNNIKVVIEASYTDCEPYSRRWAETQHRSLSPETCTTFDPVSRIREQGGNVSRNERRPSARPTSNPAASRLTKAADVIAGYKFMGTFFADESGTGEVISLTVPRVCRRACSSLREL